MKLFKCDYCERMIGGGEPPVSLKGIVGLSGGILLPEQFHESHFCNSNCFWRWVNEFNPIPEEEVT